jgi:hypothetical protein
MGDVSLEAYGLDPCLRRATLHSCCLSIDTIFFIWPYLEEDKRLWRRGPILE